MNNLHITTLYKLHNKLSCESRSSCRTCRASRARRVECVKRSCSTSSTEPNMHGLDTSNVSRRAKWNLGLTRTSRSAVRLVVTRPSLCAHNCLRLDTRRCRWYTCSPSTRRQAEIQHATNVPSTRSQIVDRASRPSTSRRPLSRLSASSAALLCLLQPKPAFVR